MSPDPLLSQFLDSLPDMPTIHGFLDPESNVLELLSRATTSSPAAAESAPATKRKRSHHEHEHEHEQGPEQGGPAPMPSKRAAVHASFNAASVAAAGTVDQPRQCDRINLALERIDLDDLLALAPWIHVSAVNSCIPPEYHLPANTHRGSLEGEFNKLIFLKASLRTHGATVVNAERVTAHIQKMQTENRPIRSRFDIQLSLNRAGYSATPKTVGHAANCTRLADLPTYAKGQPQSEFTPATTEAVTP
ncbi:MAG: hypothetical protein JWQ11_3777 [Rhizobacter sp.]|nr:hypothetical protein [Rhizobacter sp.]